MMQIDILRKRKFELYRLAAGLILLFLAGTAFSEETSFENVIVLVADGMGSTHTTVARWYKGSPLALDSMHLGAVRTYGADSIITDSAPAATAFATGHKTSGKLISVLPGPVTVPGVNRVPDNLMYKPVATVLEGAKLSGRSVGIIATSNIQHATPAGFSAHWPDRDNYNEIAEQQVYLNMDVALGGGKKYLAPKGKGGVRIDGEDLVEVLKSRGYDFVETKTAMQNSTSRKLWGMFADDDMAYEFDRRIFCPGQPALSDMTKKAIEILSKNPKGFFLFVEGSKIDWASHANDPIGVISDVLAFDDAVGVVLDFAKAKGKTMVLAFSDHGTGGMSIGDKPTDGIHPKLTYEAIFGPLKKARLTGEGLERVIGKDPSDEHIRKVMAQYAGVNDLTQDEIDAVKKARPEKMNSTTGPMISRRANIGWATKGHTGEDLFFYVYGLNRHIGLIENTDIARIIAKGMDFDLAVTGRELFVDAEEAFGKIGATIRTEQRDPANPVLIVEKKGGYAELPFSKDIIRAGTDRKEYRMQGVTVFSPRTKKVYIPRQAVSIFEGEIR
ncbi:MAG: alkaline phosphatase [Proteobacteria bacterium]|nr:alkaline phosphatase [Pseudomonadota bacterium]